MIEMHQGDEPYDDALGDDELARGPVIRFVRLVFATPALAVAGLAIGLANLMVNRVADNIGETRIVSATGHHVTELSDIRATSLIQLLVAVVALAMAVTSVIRLREPVGDDEDAAGDDRDADPPWLLGVAGAGVIVGVIGVVLSAIALGYSMHAHASPMFFG